MTLSTFWPVLGPLFLKADTATPPAYVYVARLGKYRNTATGQFVSLADIFNLRDTNETATVDTLARLSLALSDGQLPQGAWFLAMQQQLRRLTVQQGALGAGGFTALTKRDLKRMDRALQEDWPRLQAFGEAIAKGQLSEAQIRARVNMYAGHARTQFYATQRRPVHKRSEVVLERRLIKPGEVCPLCSYLASLGWQPYGSLPLPGQSVADWTDGQCYTACRCDLERQVFTRREAKTLVQSVKAFHRNFVTKGGEGSGNFGHAGRPGEVGGSMPRGTVLDLAGDLDALPAFRLSEAALQKVMDIGLPHASTAWLRVEAVDTGGLKLKGGWADEEGNEIGYVERLIGSDKKTVSLDELSFMHDYQGFGYGERAAENWFHMLGDAGYEEATFCADLTIGKYAWAREGAQYLEKGIAEQMTARFPEWLRSKGIEPPRLFADRITFYNPQDVAKYEHPDGITLKGSDIVNRDVPPDMDLPLGKAFMLDGGYWGHGDWYAKINLTHWANGNGYVKAFRVPPRPPVAERGYIMVGKPVPGGSDALFWAQYLTQDEPEPRLHSGTKAIKGGPGSGNFGHHGRPGEVGGSAPALDPDLTFPDEMEFDQHPGVNLSGDLTDLYQTFHIHPAALAAVCDLGLPDVTINVMAIKKRSGSMTIVGAWKAGRNEVGSFERELAADAQSAHLETLAFSKGYLDQGLGTKVARGWYRLLANAGYQQAELYADSTIGKYAWAKEGAQYQSAWLAADRTRKFAEWVELRKVPGLDGRLPTFANPQDVANYKHPDGYTLTGHDIQNVEVPDTLVMPLGKAFMLDNYGHGNWDATLDLTRWRETGATGKAVNMGDATDLCQIEGTGGSDAVFWAQYLTEEEGDPILGFDPAPTTKGGEGSGNFGHHGRPGEVGGSAPASGILDRTPEAADDATKEREREEGYTSPGHPDVKIKGQLYRLKEYGLTREDAATFLDLGVPNIGCRGSVSVMSEIVGEDSRIHENVLWLQGEWVNTKTGQPIGGASIYFFAGAEDVQFDILDLEGEYLNTGAGVALAKRWVGLTATRGYRNALVFADLTIGKYAWAKEGADYLDPQDARKATNRFGLWVKKRKVPGLDGRLPTFQHASEAARYQHPDGYMLKGRDIDNSDVPPDMALPVGKAFMLDDAYASWGHGSWHAALDLTRVRDWLSGTHKAAAAGAEALADAPLPTPASGRCLIFVGHDVPGGSDALFWAQYLTEGEGDPIFGVGPIVKGGTGSGNFGHAGRPGEVGGSAAGDGVHTPVLVDGEPERLAEYRLNQADLDYMLDLGLPDIPCHATVRYDADEEVLHILGYWEKDGQVIGGFERVLNLPYNDVYLEMLYFNAPYMSQGLGTRVSTRWFERLAERGYESASLYADLTIGRYAWAKEGAQYSDEQLMPFKVSRKFAQWVKARRIPGLPDDDLPIFANPQEVANYVHPDGFTLKGEDIDNTDVPPDMVLPLGKAFMLDKSGHDSWNATVNLKEWRSKGATTKATGRRGINRATAQYAIVGHAVPGGSDAVFWAQYLSEEEGDPLFGFSPTPIVKGGEGSGNFDHAGRPGEVGGSAPTTATLDRVWTGEQHEGEATVNKLETGAIGEGIVMDVLSQLHDVPFGTVNVNVNNAPFDVSGDSLAVEVKTGLATNSKSAQHWRATIGQPGKAETELLKQMSAEEKRAHNERKMQAILDRKHGLLHKMSQEAGREIHPMTMGLILSGDGTRADVFAFDGFHLRLPWNKYATPEHFLGTYDVPTKTMHWHDRPARAEAVGDAHTKAVPLPEGTRLLEAMLPQNTAPKGHPSLNLSEVEQKALDAALAAVDADFQQVFEWWCQQDKGE